MDGRQAKAEMATKWRVDLSPIRISSLAKLKRELYNQTHAEGSEQRQGIRREVQKGAGRERQEERVEEAKGPADQATDRATDAPKSMY